MNTSRMPLVSLEDVTVRYGSRTVLSSINLTIEADEWVSLLGRSGSGKSSLAYALCGFIPYEGRITFRTSQTERNARAIGVVFQSYALYPFMTCRQNIEMGLRHLDRRARRERADTFLDRAGLLGYGKRYPTTLSGGERQRVACARALARNPQLLVLDEPFAAVDIFLRESMAEWLKEIVSESKTAVLFITHSIDEALQLSDRIIVMDKGQLRESGAIKIGRLARDSAEWRTHPDHAYLKEQIQGLIRGEPVDD